jgi:hypothetical protein
MPAAGDLDGTVPPCQVVTESASMALLSQPAREPSLTLRAWEDFATASWLLTRRCIAGGQPGRRSTT